MLVLSRKKNETIVIDGNIEIQVLQINGNCIRLGISAPKEVRVLRGELKPFGLAAEPNEEASLVIEVPKVQAYTAQAG